MRIDRINPYLKKDGRLLWTPDTVDIAWDKGFTRGAQEAFRAMTVLFVEKRLELDFIAQSIRNMKES